MNAAYLQNQYKCLQQIQPTNCLLSSYSANIYNEINTFVKFEKKNIINIKFSYIYMAPNFFAGTS